jgi:acyl-CoA thioester hydrolase
MGVSIDMKLVHSTTMPIRWGDMDAFGHVNNTVYFRYMEQARFLWLESLQIALEPGQEFGPVIVNTHVSFLRQLQYPGDIICRLSAGAPGRSSFETRCELLRHDQPEVLYAEGGAKCVWINYSLGKSVPLPEFLRTLLEQE